MYTCTQMSRFSLYPNHANIIYIRWKSAFSSELTAQNIAYIALRLMANFNLPLVMYMNLWTFNISNESTWDIHFSVCFLRFCYLFILFLYLYLTACPRLQILFHFFSFQYTLSHSVVRSFVCFFPYPWFQCEFYFAYIAYACYWLLLLFANGEFRLVDTI